MNTFDVKTATRIDEKKEDAGEKREKNLKKSFSRMIKRLFYVYRFVSFINLTEKYFVVRLSWLLHMTSITKCG